MTKMTRRVCLDNVRSGSRIRPFPGPRRWEGWDAHSSWRDSYSWSRVSSCRSPSRIPWLGRLPGDFTFRSRRPDRLLPARDLPAREPRALPAVVPLPALSGADDRLDAMTRPTTTDTAGDVPAERQRRREGLIILSAALAVLLFAFFETRLPQFSSSNSLTQQRHLLPAHQPQHHPARAAGVPGRAEPPEARLRAPPADARLALADAARARLPRRLDLPRGPDLPRRARVHDELDRELVQRAGRELALGLARGRAGVLPATRPRTRSSTRASSPVACASDDLLAADGKRPLCRRSSPHKQREYNVGTVQVFGDRSRQLARAGARRRGARRVRARRRRRRC